MDAKIDGLPVAGYRAQSPESVAIVNEAKQLEEIVLRFLDEMPLSVDKRWLAIARTNIEQGFMAANRAVLQPARLTLPELDAPVEETGWVLEYTDSPASAPEYYALGVAGSRSPDHLQALRFAREEDAVAFACELPLFEFRVCQHAWS